MPARKVVPLKRKKKTNKTLFYSLLGIFFFLIFFSFVKNLLVQNLNPVGYLTWQGEAFGVEGEGYLFRKEVPVYANVSGKVKAFLSWSKVRKGDIVLEIEENVAKKLTKVEANANGVFAPVVDGLEFIGPDNLEKVNLNQVFELYKPAKLGEEVAKGQPVGKIIDNLEKMILLLKTQTKEQFIQGKVYQININNKLVVNGEFRRYLGDYSLFSLSFYPDELLKLRTVKVFIITEEKEGFLVPKTALKTINNKTYLYTLKNEEVVLTPVKIIKNVENNVLLEGETVSKDELIGRKYLIRPFLVLPGDKLY